MIRGLTATKRAGSRLPKSSKMLITTKMGTIAQKMLNRLLLKFKNESFGAMKNFRKKNFFGGNFTGNQPKIDRK